MSPFAGRAALAITLTACVSAGLASAAVANPPRGDAVQSGSNQSSSVHVKGEFIPIDDQGTYRITGTLNPDPPMIMVQGGCWWAWREPRMSL